MVIICQPHPNYTCSTMKNEKSSKMVKNLCEGNDNPPDTLNWETSQTATSTEIFATLLLFFVPLVTRIKNGDSSSGYLLALLAGFNEYKPHWDRTCLAHSKEIMCVSYFFFFISISSGSNTMKNAK